MYRFVAKVSPLVTGKTPTNYYIVCSLGLWGLDFIQCASVFVNSSHSP